MSQQLDDAALSRVNEEDYFVHSYYAEIVPETALVTEYAGVKFTAMVKKGNLWACQFHPEKSGRVGLALIKRWMEDLEIMRNEEDDNEEDDNEE